MCKSAKHPGGTLEVNIDGLTPERLNICRALPVSNRQDVIVFITWTRSGVQLFVSGEPVYNFDKTSEG
jgi:hypothetical protein